MSARKTPVCKPIADIGIIKPCLSREDGEVQGVFTFSRLRETTPEEGKNETPLKTLDSLDFVSHQVSAKCLRKRSSVSTLCGLPPVMSPAHRGRFFFLRF